MAPFQHQRGRESTLDGRVAHVRARSATRNADTRPWLRTRHILDLRGQEKGRYRPTGISVMPCVLPIGIFVAWLLFTILLQPGPLSAESIPVRYPEGTVHGFLALRTREGKLLAAGDLAEVIDGDQVVSRLVFRFKDGSVDDDTTVFSQRGPFRLISDHHIQKGPSFPNPTDVLIKAATGQVTVRYQDKGRENVETDHLDLPPDLANGMLINLMKNISPDTKETKVSYVAAAPKPRLVHLSIMPSGEE